MAIANKINVNDTIYDVHDVRISTGTSEPSGGNNGDIYFQKVGVLTSDNGWSYFYRPDGYVEMWKVAEYSSSSWYAWGSAGTRVIDNPISSDDCKYPITFASAPMVEISAYGEFSGWVYSNTNSNYVSNVQYCRPIGVATLSNSATHSCTICYHVLGVPA